MQLTIRILDEEGRIYSDEQDAIMHIKFVDGQVDLAQESVIAGQEAISSNGIFLFPSLSIR